jgi:hypothetical protein
MNKDADKSWLADFVKNCLLFGGSVNEWFYGFFMWIFMLIFLNAIVSLLS